MVALSEVIAALTPWLGSALLNALPGLCPDIQRRLSCFVPAQTDLKALAQGLDSLLYLSVRDATAGKMLICLPDGSYVRVHVSDFPMMADDLMYLLFSRFPLDAQHLMLLRDYSMRMESLSAIRVLYTRFSDYETPQELQALKRVAQACHPAFRWRQWLS